MAPDSRAGIDQASAHPGDRDVRAARGHRPDAGGDELLTLEPLSAVAVDPPAVRQVFNDTDRDALWLVVGAPPELANTLEMTPERMAIIYPEGPQALPPELS